MAPSAARLVDAEFIASGPRMEVLGLGGEPQIAFAGRSNVGKSSLLNSLTGQKSLARTSRTPGRTQELVAFRAAALRDGARRPLVLLDLPGFGYAKAPPSVRKKWGPMMEKALRGNPCLRALLFLIDIRHGPTAIDLQALELFASWEVPLLPIATKADKLGRTKGQQRLAQMAKDLGIARRDLREFSSVSGQGRDALLAEIYDLAEPPPRIEASRPDDLPST